MNGYFVNKKIPGSFQGFCFHFILPHQAMHSVFLVNGIGEA